MASCCESQEPAGDVPAVGGEIDRNGESAGAQTAPVPGEGTQGQVRLPSDRLSERREVDSGGRARGGHFPGLHASQMTS